LAECIRAAARALRDLLLPAVCPLCGADGVHVCRACQADLPRIQHPCPLCASPRYDAVSPCNGCGGHGLPHLRRVHAAFAYRGTMRHLVGSAKAGGRAGAVGALAAVIVVPQAAVDAVVPVPPSPGRRRGAHLATALARAAAQRLGCPLLPLLRCRRHAREQHRLSRADRQRNAVDLFAVRGQVPQRVLLVDDILTSGATAVAAASALARAGAVQVEACFLCRTVMGG
jgi:predicted amidophosphoribosyltransferase